MSDHDFDIEMNSSQPQDHKNTDKYCTKNRVFTVVLVSMIVLCVLGTIVGIFTLVQASDDSLQQMAGIILFAVSGGLLAVTCGLSAFIGKCS